MRSVAVRHTRSARRSRRVRRSTSATRIESSSSHERCRRLPSARCVPIERRRRPTTTGRGSRLCASACSLRPAPLPSSLTSERSSSSATSATVSIPTPRMPRGRGGPDAPQRLDRQRVEEVELALGRDDQQPVGLGLRARHLGEELRARDADRDRQPDLLAHLAPQPPRDLLRRAGDPLHPARVEERLVDRERLDLRRGVVEHLEHRAARLACRPSSAAGRRSPSGHRRLARCPPIAVFTPRAFAS